MSLFILGIPAWPAENIPLFYTQKSMRNLILSTAFLTLILSSCRERIEDPKAFFEIVRSGDTQELLHKEIGKDFVFLKDSLGDTALMVAVKNNNLPMTTFLLQKGSDPNTQNLKHKTAIQLSKENGFVEIAKIIRLHQYKDWKSRKNKFSDDALLYAVENNLTLIVSDFLTNGTDSNHTFESTGVPLLIQAIFSDSNETVKLLLENHADPNSFFDTRPAITISAMFGQYEITKMLLDASADPNLPDGPLTTALMLAAEEGHADVVKLLLEYGADANLKDLTKETALDKAINNDHIDVVKLF